MAAKTTTATMGGVHPQRLRGMVRGSALALLALGALLAAGCDDDDAVVVAPPQDVVPPTAPQAVKTVTGDGRVTITWLRNTEPDLAGYRVYRGTDSYEGPFNPLGTTTSLGWVDQNVINGSTYFYAVSAFDAAGNEGELSVENTFDTPRPEGTNVVLTPRSLEPDLPAGYDFSTGLARLSANAETDVYFEIVDGVRLMVARDLSTDIQDAGFRPLDELDWAPEEGWSPTGTAELILGHSYYVWTRTDNFAKFRVTAISNTQVRFDWAYQLQAGNPELLRTPRRTAETMAVSGSGAQKSFFESRVFPAIGGEIP
jgi:hypothetical protein